MESKRSILDRIVELDISTLNRTNGFTSDERKEHALIKTSILKHGQIRHIYIDENNNILEGNKIVLSMQELGYQKVFCIKLDCSLKDKIRLFNNLAWCDVNFVKLGAHLKDKQHLMTEIPISSQDFVDYIDFSDYNPNDFKEVKAQTDLFAEDDI